MERIEGRTALVTGAASGIGRSIATALLHAGARVVLADSDDAALRRACARLGDSARPGQLDVTDRVGWQRVKRFTEDTFGPVEILVNNAGVGPDWLDVADMPVEHFDRLVGIMLTGVFNGIHTFGPAIRSLGEGHIVNTASMAALTPMARQGAYVAAKCGVVGLSEVLRAEMEPYGIGVSVLCPARVRTNLLAGTLLSNTGPPHGPQHGPQHGGMDPDRVADHVLDGIRKNEFYIITHPEHAGLVKDRSATLLHAFERAQVRDDGH
jgi:NAD(P)-dependent dehydrogenase (short-subunit alcohol dehydrogenase family)